ncbi:MAG TPA: phosphatase PAP2 family protein, partial [Sunxiuqinia sp.]|nr:phosphatase PAP2 family protein [Sunxiuqinia sp.]
ILGLALVVADQFSGLAKEMAKRLRPTHDPAIQSMVHNVYKKGGLYSFFSSHATNTFAVALFTTRLFKNIRYSILIFFWATLVSYTRIYIGVHYPFDILTGMIVGMLIGHFMYKLLTLAEKQFFLLKLPKLEDTGLDNRESLTIILIFVLFVSTVFIAVWQLQSHHII